MAAPVAGVVLFGPTAGGGPDAPDTTPPEVSVTSSTTTTIERHSVSVPVTAPQGEPAADTLRWATPGTIRW